MKRMGLYAALGRGVLYATLLTFVVVVVVMMIPGRQTLLGFVLGVSAGAGGVLLGYKLHWRPPTEDKT
jgi:hypothetical protein